jgi:Zn-dependent M28 family amino/carboxypeptidase
MKQLRFPIVLALLLAAASVSPRARAEEPVEAALAGIRAEGVRAHIRFLSDDLLEGRDTGTRGYDLAARYVAALFEQWGLEPAGSNGTYFQPVPLRRIDFVPEDSSLGVVRSGGERKLVHEEDFLMSGHETYPATSVEAPAHFVGYGVNAPELGYDDYAGADVRGKIVVYLTGAPATFPSTQRAHYSSGRVKIATAVERGAVGVLSIVTPEFESRYPWPRIVQFSKGPSMRWLGPDGAPSDARPEIRGAATLRRRAAESLFAGAPESLGDVFAAAERGESQSFALPGSVRISVKSRHSELESPNVAAVLRGSDPALRDEYIVYTAHLDHIGMDESLEGDRIFNGAVDNASGTAALLEIARAFARLPGPPRRSVLFLAVTAEEHGLLGSDYFAHFPTVPRERIVANINMDVVSIFYPLGDVVAFGTEHSTLDAPTERAAARLGVELSPDPSPEEVFFIRSDQYSFVRQGIPALYLKPGHKSSDPNVDGAAVMGEWLRTRYHTPRDDSSQPLDFEAAAKYTRLKFLIGFDVAQQDERPKWKPGDFFGEMFGRK